MKRKIFMTIHTKKMKIVSLKVKINMTMRWFFKIFNLVIINKINDKIKKFIKI